MKHIVDKFATHDLFGRENYEYYARVTGRILKVQDEWICSFQYPPPPRGKLAQQKYACKFVLLIDQSKNKIIFCVCVCFFQYNIHWKQKKLGYSVNANVGGYVSTFLLK